MRKKQILAYILSVAILLGNTMSVMAATSGYGVSDNSATNITYKFAEEFGTKTGEMETAIEEISGAEEFVESLAESGTEEMDREETAEETVLEEEVFTDEISTEETSEETPGEEERTEEDTSEEVSTEDNTFEEESTEEGTNREAITEEETTGENITEEATTLTTEENAFLNSTADITGEEDLEESNVNLYSSATENGNYMLEDTFATLQEALQAVDTLAVSTNFYKIELAKATEGTVTFPDKALTFPSKTAGITITADKELTDPRLYLKGNITLKSNVTFEDITFVPTAKSNVSLGKFSLTLTRCKVDTSRALKGFTGISGSGVKGTSTLVLKDTRLHIYGAVNNIGTVVFAGENAGSMRTISTVPVASELVADGKINIGNIELDTDGYLTGLASVTRKKGMITKIASQITINGQVSSVGNNTLYLDLSEKVSGVYKQLDLDKAETADILNAGVQFAKAAQVTYPGIKALQRNEESALIKSNGYFTYFAAGYGVVLSFTENEQEVMIPCRTFADAVAEINSRKMKRDYMITLTSDCAVASGVRQDMEKVVPKTLTMPDKKYVNSLVIQADPEAENTKTTRLGFLKNITFTCDVTLRNVQLVQMIKAGSEYVAVDTAKEDFPAAVTIKTGGYDLIIDGEVTVNAPVILDGGNKSTLKLNESASFQTITNDLNAPVRSGESIIYGSISGFAEITVDSSNLTLKEYKTSATSSKYKASSNKITTLNLTDAALSVMGDNAKGSFAVKNLNIENGEVYVGGKISITNATLEGTGKASIFADTDFTISGTLTSKSNNATLLTRLRGAGKAPYLTVNGKVNREEGILPVYVGVYPEIKASEAIRNTPIELTNAPKLTAQLLTAKGASAVDFRPIAGNYKVGSGEYNQDNTSGYMMMKSGNNIYVYEGSKVKVAVFAKGDSDTETGDGDLFGFFPSFKEATSAVNAKKDKSIHYTYVLMDANGTAESPTTVTLPSQAKKVTVKSTPNCDTRVKTIAFSGKISIGVDTVFEDLIFAPVSKGKGSAFTLAAGSKNLTLKNVTIDESLKNASLKEITGNGKNMVTLENCNDMVLTSGISKAGTLILTDTKLLTAKTSIVGSLVLDETSSWDSLGKLTLTEVSVPEGVITSYVGVKQDTKGKPQFVLSQDVRNGNLLIKVYDNKTGMEQAAAIFAGNAEGEIEEYKDVPLVLAKKATAQNFRAYPFRIVDASGTVAENEEGITEYTWNAYKDADYVKNGTIADMLSDVDYAKLKMSADNATASLMEIAQEKAMYALVYMTDCYDVKEEPSHESRTVVSLPSAHTVQVLSMETEWNYDADLNAQLPTIWYYVQFYVGETLYKGYIEEEFLAYSDEILIQWKSEWSYLFSVAAILYAQSSTAAYGDVEQFPTTYQVLLKALKDSHPNWTFVPMNVKRDFDDCVDEQIGDYSWIYYNQPEEFRAGKINSTWYYASRAGIAYYMDPRNFLTESNIFQFEQNTYNASYHTQSALQSFLNGTFMAGKIPDDSQGRTYANVIWNSGKTRGLSPFNLAARVIQEQGINGSSAMISGTYSGFEGYYNHYNIGASGTSNEEVLKNGLTYAKNQGWNTRYKSLDGGAAFIGNGYILKGQDTLYLQKFDIEHGSSALHQYMQNIMAPYTEGRSMKSMYTEAGSLNSGFVFKIPVFDNMSGAEYTISPKSVKLEKGKTKQLTVKCNGTDVPAGTAVFTSSDDTVATVSDTGLITAVGSGSATITATVKDGDDKVELTCNVEVTATLKSISLSVEADYLYVADGLPNKIPYLDENGKTQYMDKEDCPTETFLSVTYDPEDTTDDKTVTWIVENPEILTVTPDETDVSKATVTAMSGGTTNITAKVGKLTATVSVTVRVPMREASLKLEENPVILHKGEVARINTAYLPYGTTDSVDPVWRSEDESVVKVENGELIGVGEGTTTLHAAIGPYDGSQESLTCQVTVKEYTVTFTDEDGTLLLSIPGEYGSKLENLTSDKEIPWTLQKDGYVFMGWYTGKDGSGYAIDKQSVLHGDMTLYPYFVKAETEFYAKPIGDVDYTGAYLKPAVEVYSGDTLLYKGMDYTVTYVNNKNVNHTEMTDIYPKAIIRGKGAYAGQEFVAGFNIIPKDISYTDIMVENLISEYTGKKQQMRPVLYDAQRTLQQDIDYTLSYPETDEGAYKEAGTYIVDVTGEGNYTGSRRVYVSISRRTPLSKVTIANIKDVKFNNGKFYESEADIEECRPVVELTYAGKTLVENTDYTLSYRDNKSAGTGTVIINGIGDYIGTGRKTFRIVGTELATVSIRGVETKEYTGTYIVQENFSITDKNGNVLREGLDYQLTYQRNVEAGRAYMILNGMNGYTGNLQKTFTIKPYDIVKNAQGYSVNAQGSAIVEKQAFEIRLDSSEVIYDKAGAKTSVKVSFKGDELKEGIDYKLTYANNHAVTEGEEADASVTVTGIGDFTGSVSKSFSVLEKDLTKVTMTAKDVKFRNRKGFCFVEPVLTDESGRRLTEGKDYEEELLYTYENDAVLYDGTLRGAGDEVLENDIPSVGTVIRVTVTAKGNYVGTIYVTYEIRENTSWLSELFS